MKKGKYSKPSNKVTAIKANSNGGKVVAYIRISTNKQDLKNQKNEVLEYCNANNLVVTEFVESICSSRKSTKERSIDSLIESLNQNDTLIVSELSRLGRSIVEVISTINSLIEKCVIVIVIKQGLKLSCSDMQSKVMVTMLSLLSELERDLISERTKTALAAKKAAGVQLGKPKGTIQESQFDKDKDLISERLNNKVSIRKIALELNCSYDSLKLYIKSRGLKPIPSWKKSSSKE